jgi:hypothetical protein
MGNISFLRKHYIKLKHECSLIIDKKHKREGISGNTIVGITCPVKTMLNCLHKPLKFGIIRAWKQ